MVKQIFNSYKSATIIPQAINSFLKLVVFQVGKLTLSLPVEQVTKVTKYSLIHGSGLSHVNLAHLGNQEVTIIDLHQKLFKISQDELSSEKGYFIITSNTTGDSLGIRVLQTPTLLDVPFSQIRILPISYRHADTLEVASHVAIIPQEDETLQTIFILDVDRLC
ncbi:MAG: chemotaxis protein CheW [Xenococcus sp. (in: cyanobacteria)]